MEATNWGLGLKAQITGFRVTLLVFGPSSPLFGSLDPPG